MKNARGFKKLGIVRATEHDFRDDGTSFRGYEYKGLILTYTSWNEELFLSFRPDYDYSLCYHDYCDTDWYKLCDKYNGVFNIDETELVEDLETVVKAIEALKAEIAAKDFDFAEFDEEAKEELEMTNDFLENFNAKFDWINRSAAEVKSAMSYLKYIKHYKERLEGLLEEEKSWQNASDRYVYFSSKKNGYIAMNPDGYFTKCLMDYIKG